MYSVCNAQNNAIHVVQCHVARLIWYIPDQQILVVFHLDVLIQSTDNDLDPINQIKKGTIIIAIKFYC